MVLRGPVAVRPGGVAPSVRKPRAPPTSRGQIGNTPRLDRLTEQITLLVAAAAATAAGCRGEVTMKARLRRLSVNLGLVGDPPGADPAAEEPEDAPPAGRQPSSEVVTDVEGRARQPSMLKRGLRRLSVSMIAPDTQAKYIDVEDGDGGKGGEEDSTVAVQPRVGKLARMRRASVNAIFGESDEGDKARAAEEEEEQRRLLAAEQAEEERKQKLLREQMRLDKQREEKLAKAIKATEAAERRNIELIRLRQEQREKAEAEEEEAEALRRLRVGKEREAREKRQLRMEEEKLRKVGAKAQQRDQAWRIYKAQLERSEGAVSSERDGRPDSLWRVIAPAATVCTIDEAPKEILSQCNEIAPFKSSSALSKLVRDKLVVVGLGGPMGCGKSTLAEWLRRDADALVLPLSEYTRQEGLLGSLRELGDHPASLDIDAIKKAINELRNDFRTVLPVPNIDRNLKAEANLEKIRQKLYAASYSDGGMDWLKLFKQVDKDKSGSLGMGEFRACIRKGARISSSVVSELEIREVFKAIDVDESNTLEAPEFASFLSKRYHQAEDAYGTRRYRMVSVPESRLLVLDGSQVFHPSLVDLIDVPVFIGGAPHNAVVRTLARELLGAKKVAPCNMLRTMSGLNFPLQTLHGNRNANRAHILVKNRWTPVSGESGDMCPPVSDQSRLESIGAPLFSVTVPRQGEHTVNEYQALVDWVSGAVRQARGYPVSHRRHSTVHSQLPLTLGSSSSSAEHKGLKNDAVAKDDSESLESGLWKGVEQESQESPWPEDAPLPPPLRFLRTKLLPPPDFLDDGAEGRACQRWVRLTDYGGLFHFSMCEMGVAGAPIGTYAPTNPRKTHQPSAADSMEEQEGARISSELPPARKKNGPAVARSECRWEWPWLGNASNVRDFLGTCSN